MSLIKKIELVVDSGHHYSFIPYEDIKNKLSKSSDPLSKTFYGNKIEKLINADAHEWKTFSNETPWASYCWGVKKGVDGSKDVDGLFVCIDTNIGSSSRCTQDCVKEITSDASSSHSTYVATGRTEKLPKTCMIKEYGFEIELEWLMADEGVRGIDLIVDFGNTRSVVLALEDLGKEIGTERELSKFCHPIALLERREEYDKDMQKKVHDKDLLDRQIFGSGLVLQENEFGDLLTEDLHKCKKSYPVESKQPEKKVSLFEKLFASSQIEEKKFRLEEGFPQQFAEISPAVMGTGALKRLSNVASSVSGKISMSSPKRYLWDDENIPEQQGSWHMLSRCPTQPVKRLGGQICRYIYNSGKSWTLDNPPFMNPDLEKRPTMQPECPLYPRRESMVWAALGIIENAYRQVSSVAWQSSSGMNMRRKIKHISLTYPSGWLDFEKEAYRAAWERAANIFTLAHLDIKEECPKVSLEVDEAVASQLPFVYSEIEDLKGTDEKNRVGVWMDLYGKNNKVTIMSIDIGGGTTDVSIVEYESERDYIAPTVDYVLLKHSLKFRDCTSWAGDEVRKKIIEQILLPKLFDVIYKGEDDNDKMKTEAREKFSSFFNDSSAENDIEIAERTCLTKLFLIPIADKLISLIASEDGEEKYSKNLIELVGEDNTSYLDTQIDYLDKNLASKYTEIFEALSNHKEDKLEFSRKKLENCLKDTLRPGLCFLGRHVHDYSVDLIVLSGKISEVPAVFDLVVEELNVPDLMVRKMKGLPVGSWYPMAMDGKIPDAKSVTAVGAALIRAFESNRIEGWKYYEGNREKSHSVCWGLMKAGRGGLPGQGFAGQILGTEDNLSKEVPLNLGARIGRLVGDVKLGYPEQEYLLRWKPQYADMFDIKVFKVQFQRVPGKEALEIARATAISGDSGDYTNYLELKHCSLGNSGVYWIDDGRFNVDFEESEQF